MCKTTVGKRLRELRKSKGLTQQDFAKSLRISPLTVVRYELGQMAMGMETLTSLAQDYGVNLSWLLTGTGQMFAECASVEKPESDLREIIEFLREHPEQKKFVTEVIQLQKKAVENVANAAKPARRLKPKTA